MGLTRIYWLDSKAISTDSKRTSLALELLFKASPSSDDDVIRESVLNVDSELTLVKQVSFGFEEEVDLYWFVFLREAVLLWGECKGPRNIVNGGRVAENCACSSVKEEDVLLVSDFLVFEVLFGPQRLLEVYFLRFHVLNVLNWKFGVALAGVDQMDWQLLFILYMDGAEVDDHIFNWVHKLVVHLDIDPGSVQPSNQRNSLRRSIWKPNQQIAGFSDFGLHRPIFEVFLIDFELNCSLYKTIVGQSELFSVNKSFGRIVRSDGGVCVDWDYLERLLRSGGHDGDLEVKICFELVF